LSFEIISFFQTFLGILIATEKAKETVSRQGVIRVSFRNLKSIGPTLLWAVLLVLPSTLIFGEDKAIQFTVDEGAEKARKTYIERFIKFTQDQNVAGKAKDPFGKTVQGGEKTRFNQDDGNSFQGALTYHDASYDTKDEEAAKNNPNDPKAQFSRLRPFVSSHGGVSKEGGSSELERAVYEKHLEYSKKDEDPDIQKQREKEKGVRYYSIFKEETKELEPDPKNPDQPKKVSRVTINPEVEEVISKIGKDSVQTIEKSAKDPGFENDPKTMGNLTFFREAAARASKALWDSTLANLSQRRIYNNGEGSLSESTPNCESWGAAEAKELEKQLQKDPQALKSAQDRLQERVQKCKTMESVQWSAIDPEIDGSNGKTELKEKGINFEDKYERDLRNQMEVMNRVGISPDQLKTNFQYGEDEFKNEVGTGIDDSGELTTEQMTNAEQLNAYNQALEMAIEKSKEIKKESPNSRIIFDENTIRSYQIQAGEKNILQINKVPNQMMDEMGATASENTAAGSYSELVQEQQNADSSQ